MTGFEDTAGRGVNVFYGPRTRLEGITGNMKTLGAIKQLVVELSAENVSDGFAGFFSLPAGVKPLRAIVDVEEAFVLGGTTPALSIGTDGSEGTNGFDIAEAVAEAVGVTEITSFNGTWADELAAVTRVGILLTGSTPTITSAGIVKVIVEYAQVK